MEIAGAVVAAAGDLRGRAPPRSAAVAGHARGRRRHQSHSYPDGACLYFTFAGQPAGRRSARPTTARAWDAGTRAVLADGGALSHHHGVGLNRARFVREALGAGVRRARRR